MNKNINFNSLSFRIKKHLTRFCHKISLVNQTECAQNKSLLSSERVNLVKICEKSDPLVSVLIATYNRAEILTRRVIPSILNQTYKNFEIIIVGDHCTDNTEELINKINDPRIFFHNLPERGRYPDDRYFRWLVAGVTPRNKSIELCRGDWIATLDDDDTFTHDHIKLLLDYACQTKSELVYGKVLNEVKLNQWIELGGAPIKCGTISHLATLYCSYLKFFKYNVNSWEICEPADWNMWRRMKEAGVKIKFLNKVVGKHYFEGTQRNE